jgi:hypothetical protein
MRARRLHIWVLLLFLARAGEAWSQDLARSVRGMEVAIESRAQFDWLRSFRDAVMTLSQDYPGTSVTELGQPPQFLRRVVMNVQTREVKVPAARYVTALLRSFVETSPTPATLAAAPLDDAHYEEALGAAFEEAAGGRLGPLAMIAVRSLQESGRMEAADLAELGAVFEQEGRSNGPRATALVEDMWRVLRGEEVAATEPEPQPEPDPTPELAPEPDPAPAPDPSPVPPPPPSPSPSPSPTPSPPPSPTPSPPPSPTPPPTPPPSEAAPDAAPEAPPAPEPGTDYTTVLLAFLAGVAVVAASNRLRGRAPPMTASPPPPEEPPSFHDAPTEAPTEPTMPTLDPERFDQVEPLGSGAMGLVYGAVLRSTGDPVAIKVMAPALRGMPDLRARFEREGEALARLHHPGIVKVYELTTEPSLALVMERVEGRELDAILREEAPLPLARVQELGAGLLDALAHAHAQGVLHRDLKPTNILVDGEGRPKLLDFGLARLTGELTLTQPFALAGTPQFMAPEQLRGERVQVPSDLYAVGLILYLAATGVHPFPGDQIYARSFRLPPRPSKIRDGVDPALDEVLLRCLHPDPTERYPDATTMKEALTAVTASGESGEAPTSPGPTTQLPPWLAWVNALLQAGHEVFRPLETRMALVRRYPDEPERVLELLGTGRELEETRNLVGIARSFLEDVQDVEDPSAGNLPKLVAPLVEKLRAVEAALAKPTARGVAAALEAGYAVCRNVASAVEKQREAHLADLGGLVEEVASRAQGREVTATVDGEVHALVADRAAWVAEVEAVLSEVLAGGSGPAQLATRVEAETDCVVVLVGRAPRPTSTQGERLQRCGGAVLEGSSPESWALAFPRGHRFLPRTLPASA